jgi:hypothetical protein
LGAKYDVSSMEEDLGKYGVWLPYRRWCSSPGAAEEAGSFSAQEGLSNIISQEGCVFAKEIICRGTCLRNNNTKRCHID